MKKYLKSIACAVSSVTLFISCNGLADLEKRVDSLESRVEALTTQVQKLNDNVKAVSALMNNGTINSVSSKDGVYTVVLSNGQTIVLDQGSVASSPVVSVDKDGNWMADYGDGHGSVYILDSEGSKVNAKGSDGVTPLFSVDAEGYWCVCYDGGTSANRVKDSDGKDVKATPDGPVQEQFFASVDYDSEASVLQLVLKNGTVLNLPVVTGFMCRIENAPEGVQKFSQGQSLSWDITLEGVSSVLVYKPSGWAASVDQGKLTVTAPSLTKTSAVSADSGRDVSVLAISTSGYSTVARIQVELDETPPAPVIPAVDFYKEYIEGRTVRIGSREYSLASTGEATLIQTDTLNCNLRSFIHQKSGVFFLQQSAEGSFQLPSVTEITGDVALVSRYDSAAVVIRPEAYVKLRSGSFCVRGADFDMAAIDGSAGGNTNYLMNNSNATADFTALVFDDCTFSKTMKPLLYCNLATTGFKIIEIIHSKFLLGANVQLFNLYKSTVLNVYEKIAFTHNVVCNESCTAMQLFNIDQSISQSGTPWNLVADMSNNIFYNVPSSNAYFKFWQLSSLKMNRNIFHAPSSAANASYCVILYGPEQSGDNIDCTGNIAFGLSGNWTIAHSNSTWKPSANTVEKLSDSPFESFDAAKMTYKLKTEYRDYGPQNE